MTTDIFGAWINALTVVAAAVSGIVSLMVVAKINRDSRQAKEDASAEDKARQDALVAEILALKAEMKAQSRSTKSRSQGAKPLGESRSRGAKAA